jgi:peroxiredoxin
MKNMIFVLLVLSIVSYSAFANEIVNSLVKAVKNKDIIQYSTIIKMNDESKGLTEISGNCTFKIEPKDTIIGAFYNLRNDNSSYIYNGKEYLEYYPEIYGDKIVKLLLRNKNPEEFSEQKFIMNGQTFFAPSRVMSPFLYYFSVIQLMDDLIDLSSKNYPNILSDTLINNYEASRIRINISDTIINGEREIYYYSVAFDKKTNLPVYFMKYNYSQQTEVYYSDYNFDNKGKKDLFSRKAFPKDYTFLEHAPMRTEKPLEKGLKAPDWTLTTIYDKEISLKDLKGTTLLIVFSEIACVPCMLAIPDLNDIANKFKNVKLMSIYPRDTREPLKKHAEKKKIIYDILDNSADVAKAYHVNGYPTFYLIDRKGVIKYSSSGYGEKLKKNLEDEIEKVLKE